MPPSTCQLARQRPTQNSSDPKTLTSIKRGCHSLDTTGKSSSGLGLSGLRSIPTRRPSVVQGISKDGKTVPKCPIKTCCPFSPPSSLPTTRPGPAPGRLHTEHRVRGHQPVPGCEFLSLASQLPSGPIALDPALDPQPLLNSASERFTASVTIGLRVYSITWFHITYDVISYNFTGN